MNCKCIVCSADATEQIVQNYFATLYCCPRCGKYIVESNAISLFDDCEQGPKMRASLFLYFIHNQNNGNRDKPIPHIFSENWEEGIEGNYKFISTKTILNLFPDTINEQIDMTLLNISYLIKCIGGEFTDDVDKRKELYPLFFIDIDYSSVLARQQFEEKLNIFLENGLLKISDKLIPNKKKYTLTARAWQRVQDMQRNLNMVPQVFIAMWFDDSMKIARQKIVSAIEDCGYFPVVIDEKEYNSFIVPEILYEIEKSKFIVADFTGNRGGVYFEAGYARGLNKEVIMTCREGCFDPHFDTKQINHIIWDNEEILYKRLVKRITATVGNNKK